MATRLDCWFGGEPSKRLKQKWWDAEVAEAKRRLEIQAKEEAIMKALHEKRAERAAKEPVNLRASQGYLQAYIPKPLWNEPSPYHIPPEIAKRLHLAGADGDPKDKREARARRSFRDMTNDRTLVDIVHDMPLHKLSSAEGQRLRTGFIARIKNIEEGVLVDEAQARAKVESEARPRSLSLDSSTSTSTLPEDRDARFDAPLATSFATARTLKPVDSGINLAKKAASVQSTPNVANATAKTFRSRPLASTFDDRLMAGSWQEAIGGFWPHKDSVKSEERPAQRVHDACGDSGIMKIRGRHVSMSAIPVPDPGAPEDVKVERKSSKHESPDNEGGGDGEFQTADLNDTEDDEPVDRNATVEDGNSDSDMSTICSGETVNLGSTPDPAEHIANYHERRAKWFGLDDEEESRLAKTL